MTTALLALILAVPAALFVVWPLLTRGSSSPGDPAEDAWTALETEKGLALRALRDLDRDREAGLLAEEDYQELRARDEGRAALILRRLDALGPRKAAAAPRPRPPAPATPPASVPWTQRPLVLGGGAVVLLVLGIAHGVLAVQYSSPAPAGSPGADEPVAMPPGVGPPPGGGGSPRPVSKEMLAGMLQAAHASLDAGRYQEAIAAYKAILRRDPRNVEAITHLGVILSLAGHADAALQALDRALEIDPDYAHAWWDKARVLFEQRQDYAGAITAYERFVKVGPTGPDREHALARIKEARARLAAAPAGSSPSKPAAGSGPAGAKP